MREVPREASQRGAATASSAKIATLRPWTFIASIWAVYFTAVMTIGRFEGWTRPTIWGGGAIVAALAAIVWLRSPGRVFPEAKALLAFLAVASAGYSVAQDEALYLESFKVVVEFVLIVLLVGNAVAKARSVKWLWAGLIVVTVFNLREQWAEPEKAGQTRGVRVEGRFQERAEGRTGNANALGFIAFSGVVGAAALATEVRRRRWWLLLAASAGVCVYTLLLSASRGAFFALALGFFLWVMKCLPLLTRRRMSARVVVVVAVLVGMYGLREAIGNTYVGARLVSGAEGEDESANFRGELVVIAVRLLAESPIIGAGVGQFPVASGTGYYAHNEFAELIGTVGALGAVAYYSMYFLCWKGLRRINVRVLERKHRYQLEITKTLLTVLIVAGVLFRPNYLSVDSMFLIAIVVGSRYRLEYHAQTSRARLQCQLFAASGQGKATQQAGSAPC